jgi:hypothetical protein
MRVKAALINDTSTEKHLGSNEVVDSIRRLCQRCGIIITQQYTRQEVINGGKLVVRQRLQAVDMIIVNGEGTFHRGSIFIRRLLEAIPKGKQAIIINTLWDKMFFDNEEELNVFSLITVREGMSYCALKQVYPDSKIMVVPDLIFTVAVPPITGIGYGDSVLASLKEDMAFKYNYFPMQGEGADTASYISWLRSLELYVTGRFHGVCLSIVAETPFLAFPSNSHKIEGILQDMGAPDLIIGSFKDIEKKKELAKEKIPLMQEYKANAAKRIIAFEERLKTIVQSITKNKLSDNDTEEDDENSEQ